MNGHYFFLDDPDKKKYEIGCFKMLIVPYWILDINEGVRYEFHEATKLLEAELFNGRSLKERWNNVVFIGEVDD